MIAFRDVGAAQSGSAATSSTVPRPAAAVFGDLLLVIIGVEGAAAGSGPWVLPGTAVNAMNSSHGWQQVLYQAPSATGSGLEIWAAVNGGVGSIEVDFAAATTFVVAMLAYSGEYNPTGSILDVPIRANTKAQVTGDNPASPSVYAFVQEDVIVCAADQVSGFSPPSGYTSRLDAARGGSHGNVEITVADEIAAVEGDTGALTWTATTSPAGSDGATATLAVKPSVNLAPIQGALSFRFRVAS